MKHLLVITILFTLACSSSKEVTRVAADTQTDLSGRWNDSDARLVADEMIEDALSRPWIENFKADNNQNPVAMIGRVRNETMEHIDTEVFTKEMERAFVNSGRVSVVANTSESKQIRDVRVNQQSFASLESAAALGKELGADYIVIGNISSILDETENGRTASIFYTVNLEMIDVETNQKVWIGNKQIKKVIERRRLRG
ncbi:MAG: penicillin-binding protein activator LpoB [Balneolales bacterium]|nr:penicillin-binding protein activator LpoB [Balneolales bacterium]